MIKTAVLCQAFVYHVRLIRRLFVAPTKKSFLEEPIKMVVLCPRLVFPVQVTARLSAALTRRLFPVAQI
jgi:hypothetical protein